MTKHGVAWSRWRRALAGYWDSGLTVAEYCRQRGLRAKTASHWIRRLRPVEGEPTDSLEIVPVDFPSAPGSPPPFGFDSGLRLEVGAVRIALSADFDADTLRRVVSALEARNVAAVGGGENLLLPDAGRPAQIVRRAAGSGAAAPGRRPQLRASVRVFQPQVHVGEDTLLGLRRVCDLEQALGRWPLQFAQVRRRQNRVGPTRASRRVVWH